MAQNRMKQLEDKGRSEREFEVGEEVYLKLRGPHLRSLTTSPISKLSPRYFGPFTIVAKIGKVAYKLQLPEETQIYPVFHVSLLKKIVGEQQVSSQQPSKVQEAHGTPKPAAIVDRRVIYCHSAPIVQVLVRWSNRHGDDNTWEYLLDLLN